MGKLTEVIFEGFMDEGMTTVPNKLLDFYQKLGLSNEEFILVLHLKSFIDKGDTFPDLTIIGERMGKNKDEIFQMIHQLIERKYLSLDSSIDQGGKTRDQYSLSPLWHKLANFLYQEVTEKKK